MARPRRPVVGAVVALARDVSRALVPVACPGCGLPDVRWCGDCAAPWWEAPFRADEGAGRLDVVGRVALPVWSIAPLAGPCHLMIAAWKDGARRDMDAFFDAAMARATRSVGPVLDAVTVVVPVPGRPSSTRRRGTDLTGRLAEAAAAALARGRAAPRVARCLRHRGGESRGLGARARWTGGASGIVAARAPRGEVALLVDDVVTTGASLARSCAALERSGLAVAAALTLAAAPAPGAIRDFGP